MQIRLSPSMRSITISSGNSSTGSKGAAAARHVSYRTLFYTVLALACLLPFVFILTAVMTLEGFNKCSSLDCLGRRLGPSFLVRVDDGSSRFVKDLYKMLDRAKPDEIPIGWKIPESYHEFMADVKNNKYDAKTFAVRLKATMEKMDREIKKSLLSSQLHKHFASISLPKPLHCLSLRLTDEYSSNALARKQLPPPQHVPFLTDNSKYHFVLCTDNVLAASVVAGSLLKASRSSKRVVLHVVTDKKTYPSMHSWFSLNDFGNMIVEDGQGNQEMFVEFRRFLCPFLHLKKEIIDFLDFLNDLGSMIVEVKGVNQFDWLTRENVPVVEAMENQRDITTRYYSHDEITTTNNNNEDSNESVKAFSSKLQARSPKYVSLLNHIRIYLPELFPGLNKVIFLDEDIVIQRDLTPLFSLDLNGKVNGAVLTCKGEDKIVMNKRFRNYFNFSHNLIKENLDENECAWAYGMNVFDLEKWRKTNIRETYHYWVKQNLKSNFTLWKLGTLPPALIAFRGNIHPIDPIWHLLGLGYQEKTDLNLIKKSAVIHYNGQSKPWLDIGFRNLQPFWTKHVNYSNEFVRNCHILEPHY